MRFVLVHSASHGAWCWDLLVPELNRLGHEAVPLDLPGHGTRANQAATLSGYHDAVVEQLAGDDILVGHSMGSAVAAVAADARPDLVRHITLLSGPLPVEGQCLSYQSTSASVGGTASDDLGKACPRTTPGSPRTAQPSTGIAMARTRPSTTIATRTWSTWAAERLVPQVLAPVIEPINIPRFWAANLPRSYILCLQDRCWSPRTGRLQARRMGGRTAGYRLVALAVLQPTGRTCPTARPGSRHHADRPAHSWPVSYYDIDIEALGRLLTALRRGL